MVKKIESIIIEKQSIIKLWVFYRIKHLNVNECLFVQLKLTTSLMKTKGKEKISILLFK